MPKNRKWLLEVNIMVHNENNFSSMMSLLRFSRTYSNLAIAPAASPANLGMQILFI